MINFAQGTKVFLYCQPVDMRKGMDGLSAQVNTVIRMDPFSGHLFVFRGKRAGFVKILHWDGSGLCLYRPYMFRRSGYFSKQDSILEKPSEIAISLMISAIICKSSTCWSVKKYDSIIIFLSVRERYEESIFSNFGRRKK